MLLIFVELIFEHTMTSKYYNTRCVDQLTLNGVLRAC